MIITSEDKHSLHLSCASILTSSLLFLSCVYSVARRATMPTNALKAILPSWVDSNLQHRGHHSAVAEPPTLLLWAEEEQQRRGSMFASQAEVELKDFNCHCCVFTWLQTQAVGKIQAKLLFLFLPLWIHNNDVRVSLLFSTMFVLYSTSNIYIHITPRVQQRCSAVTCFATFCRIFTFPQVM